MTGPSSFGVGVEGAADIMKDGVETSRKLAAIAFIDSVLFNPDGSVKTGTFLIGENGTINEQWRDVVNNAAPDHIPQVSDLRRIASELIETNQEFAMAMCRAGFAQQRGDRQVG